FSFFCSTSPAPSAIYSLSLHDALPIFAAASELSGGGRSRRGVVPLATGHSVPAQHLVLLYDVQVWLVEGGHWLLARLRGPDHGDQPGRPDARPDFTPERGTAHRHGRAAVWRGRLSDICLRHPGMDDVCRTAFLVSGCARLSVGQCPDVAADPE